MNQPDTSFAAIIEPAPVSEPGFDTCVSAAGDTPQRKRDHEKRRDLQKS